MEKLRNLSLKKTIALYMTVSLLCSFIMSAFLIQTARVTSQKIAWKYVDESQYVEDMGSKDLTYELRIPQAVQGVMSNSDRIVSELCDFIETYSILILSVTGACLAVVLFYNNKLRPPIEELSKAAKMVAQEELDFKISYDNRDELGVLCREFDKMRAQLAENNKLLWRMIEDEKALRAAIAHDIRSPLTVLKGYQEMLLEFIPNETLDQDQIVAMLSKGMDQIERMDDFIETMRKMNSLEGREVQSEAVDILMLKEQIENNIQMLSKEAGKKYALNADSDQGAFYGDKDLILEVVENLLSNALRYAKEAVQIELNLAGNEFTVTVTDDGSGFTESTEMVTKAFYHSNPHDDLKHFGLGMYISRLYCEKHGGRLLLGNRIIGGAIVKAVFQSNK